jgi:hypothetical protein
MTTNRGILGLAFLVPVLLLAATAEARAQASNAPYRAMAPLDQYLTPNENSEIALARSAAPPSISDSAEVLVLNRNGYTTAIHGRNGFVCIVERSWADATDDPGFWNPKVRAPNCFNAAAARTFVPIYLMKTKLALAGRSKAEIARAIETAFDKKAFPALGRGAMCYMMSEQQYLNDRDKRWHPHLMFYAPGDAAKSWGANLPGSPVIGLNDAQERATVFLVLVGTWSDGTPAPPIDR